MDKDFGKEAPFQQPTHFDLSKEPMQTPDPSLDRVWGSPSQLDRIEQMLTLLLGAPPLEAGSRAAPVPSEADRPSGAAMPGRASNPSSDLPSIMEDGEGGFIAKLSDGSTVVYRSPYTARPTEKPEFSPDKPIAPGSISYKMRFVDADGEHIKGEPRVFLDPEQPTPAWEPSEGDIVVVSASPNSRATVKVGRRCEGLSEIGKRPLSNVTNANGFEVQCIPHECMQPATELEIQQWEAEQEAKKPLVFGMKVVGHGEEYLWVHVQGDAHVLANKNGVVNMKRSEFKVIEP